MYIYIHLYFTAGLHVPCIYAPLNISNVHSFCEEALFFSLYLYFSLCLSLYKIYRRFAKRSTPI